MKSILFTTVLLIGLAKTDFGQSIANSPAGDPAADYLSAPNQFVNVAGTRFAYRKLGKNSAYPLVLLPHFRGSMDNWDPELIDALARQRTVIVFDNKGV